MRNHIGDAQSLGTDMSGDRQKSMRHMLLEVCRSYQLVRHMEMRIQISGRKESGSSIGKEGRRSRRDTKNLKGISSTKKRGGEAQGDKIRPSQSEKKIILIRLRTGHFSF